jgi:hypothetical protein
LILADNFLLTSQRFGLTDRNVETGERPKSGMVSLSEAGVQKLKWAPVLIPPGVVGHPTALSSVPRVRSFVTQALARKAWDTVEQLLGDFRMTIDAEGNAKKVPNPPKVMLEASRLVIEYHLGKPVQSVEVNLRDKAMRVAERYGCSADDLVAEALRLAAEDELN